MARPVLVFLMNRVRATIITALMPMVRIELTLTLVPAMFTAPSEGRDTLCAFAPKMSCAIL